MVSASLLACGLMTLLLLVCPTDASSTLFAYITNPGSNSVSVIDAASNVVVEAIPVGSDPHGVAVNLVGARVCSVAKARDLNGSRTPAEREGQVAKDEA